VRVDTGVRNGDTIGINYDPMIAKLVVHGPDRATALARLGYALREYQILGPNTNLDFLGRLVAMPAFREAKFDTGFIATHHEQLFAEDDAHRDRALVLAAAAMLPAFDFCASEDATSPWDLHNHWRMNLPGIERMQLLHDDLPQEIIVEQKSDGWYFSCAERCYRVDAGCIDEQRRWADVDGEHILYAVVRDKGALALAYDGQTYRFELPESMHDAEKDAAAAGHPQAPMSGAVVAVAVAAGDRVEAGDTLMVIEAMKMEHAIVAQNPATVAEVLFSLGDQVDEGETLVTLEVE
jgi:3-methylcrotonyl-CoA carboxylase alpha subunit